MKKIEFTAKEGRLLRQLEESGVPYAAAQRALREKDVLVNGARVRENVLLHEGDAVRAYYAEPEVRIAFENDRLLVADKPQGLATEDGESGRSDRLLSETRHSEGHRDGANGGEGAADSLESRVRALYPGSRLCHRLDRNTGGLVLFAKDDEAYAAIDGAIRSRTIRKFYQCIVVGAPEPAEGVAKAYLVKDAAQSRVTIGDRADRGAKEIVTAYRTLRAGELSLVEVELITGRTHQIRAHMAYLGCPILGDDKYGDRAMNKRFSAKTQALFAVRLELFFPEGSPLSYLNGTTVETRPRFPKRLMGALGLSEPAGPDSM